MCQTLTCSQVVYPLQNRALKTVLISPATSNEPELRVPQLAAGLGRQADNARKQELVLLLKSARRGMQRNRDKADSIPQFSNFGELVFAI